MKKRNLLVGLSIMTFLVSALSGCGSVESKAAENETITIRLADQSPSFALVYSYAQDKGYFNEVFKNDNVKIEISDFESGPAVNEAFAANQLDIATVGAFPAITGFNNNYGYKIIGKINYTDYFPLIATTASGVNSSEDLKGKKLGTSVGGQYHYLLLKHLENAGLKADDVQIINSGADTPTMTRSNDIDRTALSSVNVAKLVQEGSAVILSENPGDIIAGYIVASDEFTEKNPEIAQKFVNAMNSVVSDIAKSPDEYATFISEKTGTDRSYIDSYLSHQTFEIDITNKDLQSLKNVSDFLFEQGILDNSDFKIDELINKEYLDNIK